LTSAFKMARASMCIPICSFLSMFCVFRSAIEVSAAERLEALSRGDGGDGARHIKRKVAHK
jgi:hypothetical protein